MEMKFFSFYAIVAALLVVANFGIIHTSGQSVSCLNQLAPCLNYLNGTKDVPEICCNPLNSVIRNNPECLCRMISNRGSSKAEQAGINVNDAQMLPARCGEHVNPIACLTRTQSFHTYKNSSSFSFNSLKNGFVWILCRISRIDKRRPKFLHWQLLFSVLLDDNISFCSDSFVIYSSNKLKYQCPSPCSFLYPFEQMLMSYDYWSFINVPFDDLFHINSIIPFLID